MKLTKCLNCGVACNKDLKDAWVCDKCGALHQTTCDDDMIEIVDEFGSVLLKNSKFYSFFIQKL
jgi:peptide subunit release factor 1 (eRF1)